MSDLKIIETGSGGDLVFNGNDFVVVSGFQNMPYLAMFGGNKEQSTKTFLEGEERFDYWANELFMFQEPQLQYNSKLEALLEKVSITSSSIIKIEEAIKDDLSFMNALADVECNVYAKSVDRLKIEIKINQKNDLDSSVFSYIWDATKKDFIIDLKDNNKNVIVKKSFNNDFSNDFN